MNKKTNHTLIKKCIVAFVIWWLTLGVSPQLNGTSPGMFHGIAHARHSGKCISTSMVLFYSSQSCLKSPFNSLSTSSITTMLAVRNGMSLLLIAGILQRAALQKFARWCLQMRCSSKYLFE